MQPQPPRHPSHPLSLKLLKDIFITQLSLTYFTHLFPIKVSTNIPTLRHQINLSLFPNLFNIHLKLKQLSYESHILPLFKPYLK